MVAPHKCAVPVVAFHGTADHVVPYGPGTDPGVTVVGPNSVLPGVDVNMARWAANEGCSRKKEIRHIAPDVDHWIYRCPAGKGVELYSIEHGDHTWPGSPIELPHLAKTDTISATRIALDWFGAHPKRDRSR